MTACNVEMVCKWRRGIGGMARIPWTVREKKPRELRYRAIALPRQIEVRTLLCAQERKMTVHILRRLNARHLFTFCVGGAPLEQHSNLYQRFDYISLCVHQNRAAHEHNEAKIN